jgi:hypothetical protein
MPSAVTAPAETRVRCRDGPWVGDRRLGFEVTLVIDMTGLGTAESYGMYVLCTLLGDDSYLAHLQPVLRTVILPCGYLVSQHLPTLAGRRL